MVQTVINNIKTVKGNLNFKDDSTTKSVLGLVINELSNNRNGFYLNSPQENSSIPFKIEEKIKFNDLVIYKDLISDYFIYSKKIKEVYNILEDRKPYVRNIILGLINDEYKKIRGTYIKKYRDTQLTVVNIIQKYADNIIEKILSYLKSLLDKSKNNTNDLFEEDIKKSLNIILVDAFVECKILENPNIEVK